MPGIWPCSSGWEECTIFDEMETDGDRVKDVLTFFAG